jgi:hypothetical protein
MSLRAPTAPTRAQRRQQAGAAHAQAQAQQASQVHLRVGRVVVDAGLAAPALQTRAHLSAALGSALGSALGPGHDAGLHSSTSDPRAYTPVHCLAQALLPHLRLALTKAGPR